VPEIAERAIVVTRRVNWLVERICVLVVLGTKGASDPEIVGRVAEEDP
jgi:hypothetical protein